MWKLVPKSEVAELIPLCIKSGLPILWGAEGGAFITLDSHSYESSAKHGYGRLIVWIGEGEPWYAEGSTPEDACIYNDDLDARQPDWRD